MAFRNQIKKKKNQFKSAKWHPESSKLFFLLSAHTRSFHGCPPLQLSAMNSDGAQANLVPRLSFSLSQLAAPLPSSLPSVSLSSREPFFFHGVHVRPPTNQLKLSSSGNTRGSRLLRRSRNAMTGAGRRWDNDDDELGRSWLREAFLVRVAAIHGFLGM